MQYLSFYASIFTNFETETPWTLMNTSQSWSRTSAPVRNLQHPPNLQQCHWSLRVFLMPSNSTDFNQNLNRASSEQMQTIQNFIKETSPSQEHTQSSSTLAKTPKMSSIFERVFDAFKLNRFQPNFKQGFLGAYANHPKFHQGHKPQSVATKFIHSFLRACVDNPKHILYPKLNWGWSEPKLSLLW